VGAFSFTNSKGKLVSNTNKFTTTFGIWIFNVLLIKGFNLSFIFDGYINDNIDKKKFGKIHQKILYALLEDKINTMQYKNFIQYVDFIMPWETVLAPAQSERLLSCTKEIDKMKAKLLKENKEAVDSGDPAVVESIEKKLLDFAKEYLKDDPSLDAYLSGAGGTLENNFKNMYIMKGVIRNPDPNAKQEYNTASSSFLDGISSEEYSLLANSLSGGPYSRAKKTEIGGYWEKLIEAAVNTVKIDGPDTDCGTTRYIETVLTDDIISSFMYSYIIKDNGTLEELTSENIDKYRNKKVKVRSTMFCKSKTGVCHHCAGNFFYRRGNPNIGLACSQIATVLKLRSMKSFHDSTITTAEMDPMMAFMNKKN
jgi:DNA-directed RNA polymerase subunit beta'